jgi:hypothetical protein
MDAAASAAIPRLQRVLEALAAGLAAVGQSLLLRRRLAFELQLLSRCMHVVLPRQVGTAALNSAAAAASGSCSHRNLHAAWNMSSGVLGNRMVLCSEALSSILKRTCMHDAREARSLIGKPCCTRLEGSEVVVDALESLGGAAAAAVTAALREAQPPTPPPPLLEGHFLPGLTDTLDRAGRMQCPAPRPEPQLTTAHRVVHPMSIHMLAMCHITACFIFLVRRSDCI